MKGGARTNPRPRCAARCRIRTDNWNPHLHPPIIGRMNQTLRHEMEMFSALYDFCRDQGSIIGGLLALAAGYLVFRGATRAADRQVAAAHAQTEAVRQQNRDLRNEGRHRQAQDGIVATKLLASVLAIIINDVD